MRPALVPRLPARLSAPLLLLPTLWVGCAVGAGSDRPQDPQGGHIDQRLPEPVRRGPREYRHRWQPLVASVDVGFGSVMARAEGTGLDDRTDAVFARGRIDAGNGAALEVDWWRSDDELFRGQQIDDGLSVLPADAELDGVDVFPHVRLDGWRGEGFRVPLRIGVFSDWQQLHHEAASIEREWLAIGPRIVFEPTWTITGDEAGGLQLVGRGGGDLGPAWFRERLTIGGDRDVTVRASAELGVALRGVTGALHAEIGYRLRHVVLGEIETDVFGSPDRTELQRQQLFLGVGVTF